MTSRDSCQQSLPVTLKREVNSLLESGKSESIVCRQTFSALIDDGNTEGICTALRMFDDIPEETIVKTLNYFLSVGCVDNETGECSSVARFDPLIFSYVDIILDLSYTDIFLQEQLRQMSVGNTKLFLKYLCHCLSSLPPSPRGNHSTLTKICDWLCILLDAHFHTITLSSDEEFLRIINNLSRNIKSKFSYLEELDKLEDLLENIRVRQTSTTRNVNLPYCIETLTIR